MSTSGNLPYHIKFSTDIIRTLGSLWARPHDIMISFVAVSLFIRVLIIETLNLLSQHFIEDILRLFRHVLTSSFFSFHSKLNILRVLHTVSPLSLVIASHYMEKQATH
jgi:hypothetical protein